MSGSVLRLGVNIDHVATVRNARGGTVPDPVRAAKLAIAAGADGITAHLREDRRHIRDEDMRRLKAEIDAPLNFEMAATDDMVAIALATRPHGCCLVPEKRSERTTEGGLDVVGGHDHLKVAATELASVGIRVSLFIEPSPRAIAAARSIGAPVVELHTGAWCDAIAHDERDRAAHEFERIRLAAQAAESQGIECHAGHGLDFETARIISALPQIVELNIGHFLIGEAIFFGLEATIAAMRASMRAGRTGLPLEQATDVVVGTA
ncbi:pyridoxine 5'-phosphate synthase [Beijerinckia sp. L45]|uniref:pyridoxine 5'-phosphate synthase n=1 Tax=Beijerinckia sp. L45 TaxID=1641855 RepID=UPI00131E02B8|nr:pyridoxine 5'-phosphate synthase [Beijerinckia sp. L45]